MTGVIGFMHRLYLDCSSGIAGDMLLAALIDLGAPLDDVREGLAALDLSESWNLTIEETSRRGVSAKYARVTVDGRLADEVPDHEHHHGHHDHVHHHEHHDHDHDHSHGHDHSHDHAPSRPYRVIRELLETSSLPDRARERAQRVFWELAKSESAVHGTTTDEVHFHEVGSTDAIIDVVGVCLALELLDIDIIDASPLHVGRGFVTAAHGRMPVPAPATLRLLEGLEAYQTDITGELVTPTGAALVKGLCRSTRPLPHGKIIGIGWGAGAKDFPIPNVLRAILMTDAAMHMSDQTTSKSEGLLQDDVVELSANIDDMNPQLFGPLFQTLLDEGALDVWIEPATMKKGRPGHILHALAEPQRETAVARRILEETTSLGVRRKPMSRWKLTREHVTVETQGGLVSVKLGRLGDSVSNVAPEFDDCVRAARTAGVPVKHILNEAHVKAMEYLEATH